MRSIENGQIDSLSTFAEAAEPKRLIRAVWIAAAVFLAHAALLGLIAWSERSRQDAGKTSAVEIPVEMATPEEAEGRPNSRQAGRPPSAPPAIEPRGEAREKTPEPPASAAGAASQGKIAERPKESDRPQAARTQGSETRPVDPKDEAGQPFGGLAAVEKPASAERLPTFAAPQSLMTAARPRPAQDPTNDNYRAKVLGKVAANMIDPERPRPKALAIVGFRVDAQGGLDSVWLARPSGHADLDAEAVDMVRRSAPFPAPPAGADRNFGAAIAFGEDGG